MELSAFIEALRRPEAFPETPDSVEVRQTHISAVFLAGPHAYKLKKPVNLGFLDFTTLDKRLHFCREEVRLNRRLAPEVYLGVVPIVRAASGFRFEGEGEPVDWAVKMARLPEEATLLARIQAGTLDGSVFPGLGRRIAAFHREAECGPEIAAHGRYDVVARLCRENLEQARPHAGITLSSAVRDRLADLNAKTLARRRETIEARALAGLTRDTHGDLHLDHVFYFPDRPPPADLAVIDCVEFSPAYRCGDVVSDMAFLCMDLLFRNRRPWMDLFAEAYFGETEDHEGMELLPFYIAYRAAVRAKVEGIAAAEREVPEEARLAASASARGHWLLALAALEEPARRPALMLTAGPPGSGKTQLALDLADRAGFARISSDEVRKELAGIAAGTSARAGFGEGIYTEDWNRRTYAECLRRAEAILFQGGRALVDASFREERYRREFLDLAARYCVDALFFHRTADPDSLRDQIGSRRESGSDADWGVSREVLRRWEAFGTDTARFVREIPRQPTAAGVWERAEAELKRAGLF